MKPISLDSLVFRYRDAFQLGPLTLEFGAGSRHALIGPSGCGKSTLLRCIAGLERVASGAIHIGERTVDGPAFVRPDERKIGFVFQDGALWPHMTAIKHLRFVDPSLSDAGAGELLERVGLGHAVARRPAQLSGGEAQRLALARALAGQPEILLLDEPLSSVDVHLRDELGALVRSIVEEHRLTLVVVTHDRDEALAFADRIVVLRDGAVVEQGSASEVMREPRSSFGARFFGRATCIPVDQSDGKFVTPFGVFDGAAPPGRYALVLLPGEVRVAAAGAVTALVRHVRPDPFGRIAIVEVEGRSVTVACDEDVVVGQTVGLELSEPPRFLVDDTRLEGDDA